MWCATSQHQHIQPATLWLTQWLQLVTLAFTSTPTWAWELTYSEQCCGVSPYSVSCDRFAGIYLQPRSRVVSKLPDIGGSFSSEATMDNGNGVLVGLPAYLVRQHQSVLNASARMIFQLRRSDHITDALASLHWLCVRSHSNLRSLCWRIKFFMGLHHVTWVRLSDLSDRRCLRSVSIHCLVVPSYCPLLAVEHLRLLLPEDVTTSPTLPIFLKS